MDARIPDSDAEDADIGASLADRTYVQLREDIITVKLPPGTLLREPELMRRLDMGRTPVREALLRLQRDGFVVVAPRRGTFVSQIDITDLTAIYEARAKIESWATRLAAQRLSNAERSEAKDLIAALQAHGVSGELEPLLALDRRVHRFIYRSAKNPYLFETLDHYHNLSLRVLYVMLRRFPSLMHDLNLVVQEQTRMLEAVCRGDADTAETIALHHVLSFQQDVRQII